MDAEKIDAVVVILIEPHRRFLRPPDGFGVWRIQTKPFTGSDGMYCGDIAPILLRGWDTFESAIEAAHYEAQRWKKRGVSTIILSSITLKDLGG